MPTFVVNASPRAADARSFRLALRAAGNVHAGLGIRHLATDPPEPISAEFVDALMSGAPADTPAVATSERLVREIEAASHLIVSTPMHNYSLPAALKLWFDHVIRYGRTFSYDETGKIGLLADRPTLVVVSTGAALTASGSQPNHFTRLITDLFAMIGIKNVRFVYLEQVLGAETAKLALEAGAKAVDDDPHFGVHRKAAA